MARWATMVKSLREEDENVLLLDSGNAFVKKGSFSELTAETTIRGMNLIRYDALNIGQGELSMGLDVLENLEAQALFPFISANIFLKENGLPLGEQFVIKAFNGLKVGITGVISPTYVATSGPAAKQLTVQDPAITLTHILPEMHKQCDVVILLSHLGETATRDLAQSISGIDIAVVGNDSDITSQPQKAGDTLILKNCKQGEYVGILKIFLDSSGKIAPRESTLEKVAGTITPDSEVYRLVHTYKKERAVKLEAQRKQTKRQAVYEDMMKQLQTMSPEEFIRNMQREQELPAVVTPENVETPAAENH